MALILHITSRSAWQQADRLGRYDSDTLTSEGFMHCSTPAQLLATANRFFLGQSGLVLVCIDSDRVEAEIRYEESEPGERFPHIYGPLNLDAVTQVLEFEPQSDGSFTLPSSVNEA